MCLQFERGARIAHKWKRQAKHQLSLLLLDVKAAVVVLLVVVFSNSAVKLLLYQIINEQKKPAVFRSHTTSLWRKSVLPPPTWSFQSHKPCRLKWSVLASADRQLRYKSNEMLTEGSENGNAAATSGAQIRLREDRRGQIRPDGFSGCCPLNRRLMVNVYLSYIFQLGEMKTQMY